MMDHNEQTNRGYVRPLSLQATLTLRPTEPFNFVGTVHKPSHFPMRTDTFLDGALWFTMRLDGYIVGICLRETPHGLEVLVFAGSRLRRGALLDIEEEVRFRFDLDADLHDFVRLAEADPMLGPIERRWRGLRPSCAYSLYELICITIALQNAQVTRSERMMEALLDKYGSLTAFGGLNLFAFWGPTTLAEVSEEDLRQLKLGYRAKSYRRVSEFFAAAPAFEREVRPLDKSLAGRELRRIYGVGPATCWYLLFEKFHHYDAFDYVSPWETKILSQLFFHVDDARPQDVLDFAWRRWGHWRMLAVHYLFEDLFWQRSQGRAAW